MTCYVRGALEATSDAQKCSNNKPIKSLYLGGSDTVSNTIRWAFLILTEYPDVQERCYEELLEQTSEEGRENIDGSKCHYTQSVLLECRRLHPVGNCSHSVLILRFTKP